MVVCDNFTLLQCQLIAFLFFLGGFDYPEVAHQRPQLDMSAAGPIESSPQPTLLIPSCLLSARCTTEKCAAALQRASALAFLSW